MPAPRPRETLRWAQVLWVLAPFVLFLAVVSQKAALAGVLRVIAGTDVRWVLAALVLQAGFVANQGAFYRSLFRLLDIPVTLAAGVQLALVMAFAGQAFPGGTAVGIAYFVAVAQGQGVPVSGAFLASLAYYLFDYSAFLLVLAVGVAVLLLYHDLTRGQLVLVAVFLGLVVTGASAAAWLVRRGPREAMAVERLVSMTNRLSQRFRRRPLLTEGRVEGWVAELSQMTTTAARRPDLTVRPAIHALLVQMISLGILASVFRAVDAPLYPGALIAGYAMGVLFSVVSITPSGVGVVEGAMTVVMTSLFVPVEAAVSVTLLFRVVTLGLPLVVGFMTLRMAATRPQQAEP